MRDRDLKRALEHVRGIPPRKSMGTFIGKDCTVCGDKRRYRTSRACVSCTRMRRRGTQIAAKNKNLGETVPS